MPNALFVLLCPVGVFVAGVVVALFLPELGIPPGGVIALAIVLGVASVGSYWLPIWWRAWRIERIARSLGAKYVHSMPIEQFQEICETPPMQDGEAENIVHHTIDGVTVVAFDWYYIERWNMRQGEMQWPVRQTVVVVETENPPASEWGEMGAYSVWPHTGSIGIYRGEWLCRTGRLVELMKGAVQLVKRIEGGDHVVDKKVLDWA